MPHSKSQQFLQSTGQVLMVVSGTVLLSLISNDISYEVQSQNSVLLRFIPYFSLSIMMLIIWCAFHYFLTDGRNPQDKECVDCQVTGRVDPHIRGPSDPQDTGRLDPQVTRHPDLPLIDPEVRDMVHCFMNENGWDEFRHVDSEILSPRASESSSRAQQRSDFVSITIHTKRPVPAVETSLRSRVTLPVGSKVLYRRFEIGPHTQSSELDKLMMEMTESMRQARTIDKDCNLQLGSFAVLKYTEAGPKWWRLQKHWTPTISNIHRSSCSLVELALTGCHTKWSIRGFNLQGATLKASTIDEIEMLNALRHEKVETGEDVLLCDEPHLVSISAPMFQKEVYICASRFVEGEDGVTFNLQTEPKSVMRPYWISVLKTLMPSPWTMLMIASFSVMGGLSRGTHGKQAGLFGTSASNYLDLQHDDNNFGVDKEANSILSHILSELYKSCLVYIFAIVIPSILILWRQLSTNVRISPLGTDIHGLGVTQTSEDVTSSSPTTPPSADGNSSNTTSRCSTTATPVADALLEDTSSRPRSTIIRVEDNWFRQTHDLNYVMGFVEEGYDDRSTPPSASPPEDLSNKIRYEITQRTRALPGLGKLKRKSEDLEASSDNDQGAEKNCTPGIPVEAAV